LGREGPPGIPHGDVEGRSWGRKAAEQDPWTAEPTGRWVP